MLERAANLLRRHPLVRDALLWSIPAIIAGFILRALFLSYSPYAYWGSDSESYSSFAYQMLTTGDFSMNAKRRYLYPILMVPMSALPGSPLRWVALFQHAAGLLTVVPLAYVLRKCLAQWRWTIIPATLAYATMPVVLWYEHEVLAEHLFFSALIWGMAGWCAWIPNGDRKAGGASFWWLFTALAALSLTKPSARFFWPGLVAGAVLFGAWRHLNRKGWIAILLLLAAMATVGQKGQGLRLLYTTAFPLTQLDTPQHAEFKAEIRQKVEPLRRNIWAYHALEDETFLRNPWRDPDCPTWRRLENNDKLKNEVYRDLALEAVRAHPGLFLSIGVQRAISSANPAEFDTNRFEADYFARRFESQYEHSIVDDPKMLEFALARPADTTKKDYEPVRKMLAPKPDSRAAVWLKSFADSWQAKAALFTYPDFDGAEDKDIRRYRPSPLCWMLLAGMALSFLPTYRRTLGVGTLVALSYSFGVFLVGSTGARYIAPAYLIFIPLLALPFDVLLKAGAALLKGRQH
jgi:hypothetical protein